MSQIAPRLLVTAALLVFALPPMTPAQKVKVYQSITNERIEAILKDLNITYKKAPVQPLGGFDYLYDRSSFKIRLNNFNGSDLWIDATFAKISAENANEWNRRARLSRAVLISGQFGETVSLEAQMVCVGGVTDGMVRQFIDSFDKEVRAFADFLRDTSHDEQEIKKVTSAHLQSVMKQLSLEFKLAGNEGKEPRGEFTLATHKVQLTCHEGTVVLLRSKFPSVSLDRINKYNTDRRYVRAYLEDQPDGKKATILEAYLDCRGGVTETILQQFIRRFEVELKEMDRFVTI